MRSRALTRKAVLVAITLAALCLRVAVLIASARLGADEAVPGLMARRIVNAGELPVFFWGQAYFGALESYLIAALFALFGFHWWLVFVPALVASTALVPMTWALADRLGPWPAGLLAALPIAFPPPVFSRLLGNAGGGFALSVSLQVGAVLCVLHARTASPATRPRGLALSSLLVGLAVWVWQPALVALLPAWLALLAVETRRQPIRFAYLTAPLAVGLAPMLAYNISLDWPTALALGTKFADQYETRSGPLEQLTQAAWVVLVTLGGGEETLGGANFPQALLVAAAFIVQPAAVVFFMANRPTPVWQARAFATGVVLLVSLLNALAVHTAARYLVLAALAGFALSGAMLAYSRYVGRLAQWLAVGLAVVIFGLANLRAYASIDSELAPEQLSHIDDARAALAALEQRGLRVGYADYWAAYPIMYLSGERIVLAPKLPHLWGPATDRYPAYSAAVAAAAVTPQFFLLVDRRCGVSAYLAILEQSAATYTVEDLARWSLVWAIQAPQGAGADWLTYLHDAIATPAPCPSAFESADA
jgi:hypothetical protein